MPPTLRKNDYYLNHLRNCKGNSAATWNIVKDIVPSKNNSNIPTSMTDSEFTKAEKFNSFFASVGQSIYEETQNKLASENRNINFPPTTIVKTELFRPQPVDVSTVVLTIKRLQATKSFGSDLISFRFLKDSLCITAHYLTVIINTLRGVNGFKIRILVKKFFFVS